MIKEVLALTATALIFLAYIPYISDIKKEKTRPHPYTWFISGLITFIAFGLQLANHAGWGLLPMFIGGSAGLVIFALSLKYKRAAITKVDTLFFVIALIAMGLWLIAHQPLLAVIIISSVDILAFIPTIRKSWNAPYQETLSTYFINCLRLTLATLAVQHYNLVAILYPLSGALTDGPIAIYLIIRRRTLRSEPANISNKLEIVAEIEG